MKHSQIARMLQHPAAPAFVAGVLAILVYAVTLGGTYVYDDVAIVRDDERVHSVDQWPRIWTTDYFDGGMDNLYRPIVTTSYAIEWLLHGDRPWIFHGVNVLLNASAAAVVAEFARRSLRATRISQSAAYIAGLLFAAHPVHVEAVANIVGRAELLCTACIFSGLILLTSRPLTGRRVLTILSTGVFAVLCKEQGILQPILWALCGWLISRWMPTSTSRPAMIPSAAKREVNAVKILVLLTCWVWAAYLLGREHFLRFEWDRTYIDITLQPLILSREWDQFLMPVVLLGRYVGLLFFPLHLIPDYGADVIGHVAHSSDPYLWLGFASLLAWFGSVGSCLLLLMKAKAPLRSEGLTERAAIARFVLFCLLSLGFAYGMIGNIVTLIATNFAERLMYLPSAFFLMPLACLIAYLPIKPRVALLSICLALASFRTVAAAREWNHPRDLFEHGLVNAPASIQLALLLSVEDQHAGKIAEAHELLKNLCQKYPDYWRIWMFRADEDVDDGLVSDAEMSLKKAIKMKAVPRLLAISDRLTELKATTRSAATSLKK